MNMNAIQTEAAMHDFTLFVSVEIPIRTTFQSKIS